MAKAPASDSIMAPDKMKPLLALSKREPVQAAIGLTSDGEGVILLDKKAKPKKVFSLLKSSAAKAKLQLNTASLRFGRAEVDTDYDSGMVRFFVNKEAPGNMRIKLVEVIKRIPYQKVEINVDPSLEEEPEEDGDEAAPSSTAAPSQPEATQDTAPPPVAPPPPALDAATLRRDLAGLIGRIAQAAGNDGARKAVLVTLATQGNDAFKAGNLEATANFITQLRQALDQPAGQTLGQSGGPPAVEIWNTAKESVDGQLNQLYAKLKGTGLPVLGEVATEIETVLEGFRTGLITSLMNYDRAAGPAKETARAAALTVVVDYKTRLLADKHVIAADTNPFGVAITARTTLGQALDQLSTQLAPA